MNHISKYLKPISKCSNKHIYHKILCNQIKPPTALDKWIMDIFPFLEKEDWALIFKITFEVTKEPYLQSFQFQILNRILNTNENLFKWKIHGSNEWRSCGEVDGVEHHLFDCKDSKLFWKRLKEWMISNRLQLWTHCVWNNFWNLKFNHSWYYTSKFCNPFRKMVHK